MYGWLAPKGATAAAVDALLEERGITVVMHEGWCAIDEAERSAGEKLGGRAWAPGSWDELLRAAGQAAAAPIVAVASSSFRGTRCDASDADGP